MSGPDGIYRLTRRKGTTGTITKITGSTTDAKTGTRTDTECVTTIRWMVKEPTAYSRFIRAEATQQKVGETTFVVWTKDPVVAALLEAGGADREDWVTFGGKRYEVVSSTVEETAYLITARENRR